MISLCLSALPSKPCDMADACKMSSPEKRPASKAEPSPARKSAPVFKTTTNEDWKRSLTSARQQKNAVSEQIRTAIS
ncbi:MAG TPA: hypothetical protein VGE76_06715, partial [Opitutaceae bacterium]